MKSIEIKVTVRKNLGKKQAQALRLNKNVPCVLYGGKENVHFSAEEKTFKDILYTHDVYLIDVNIDGNIHQAILKEVQFHPVTEKILHLDFVEVLAGKPIVVNIPVDITGSSVGVLEGGKIRLSKRYVRVKGMVADIPNALQIDISDLNIGQSVLAGDLSYDKFEILEPKRAAVVSVVSSRAATTGMGEEPVEAVVAPVETPEAAAEAAEAAAAAAAAPAPEQPKK